MGLTGIVSFDRHYLRYQSAMTSMLRFAPLLFVVLWSTGFIGAKLGLPHAEPLTFLLIRYALVIVLMAVIAIAMRAPGCWFTAYILVACSSPSRMACRPGLPVWLSEFSHC